MSDEIQLENPLLSSLRIPGETFRLPSQGLFYQTNELDDNVTKGELEVYPMTAIDEIILNTPDKLLSGKAIMEIFSHCIPQIRKPYDLLGKDVDFLMVCLRMVSFGPTMEITYQHDCEKAKEHHYTVDLQKMIREARSIDPTTINQEFVVNLSNGQVVTLQPLTYGQSVILYQTTAMAKTDNLSQEEAEKLIVDALVSVIKSVDGVIDRKFLREWMVKLPIGWKRQIEQTAQKISQWGVSFNINHKCKDCGKEMAIPVSANPVNFFM